MFFFIDESVSKLIENYNPSNDYLVYALENIAKSRMEGKHVVFGNRNTLKILKNWNLLGVSSRNIYKKISETLTEIKSLESFIKIKIKIIGDDYNFISEMSTSSNDIKINIKKFSEISTIMEPIFISENISDVRFYNLITRSYMFNSGVRNIPLKYEERGGGGSTTSVEYESIIKKNNRFCFCLIDSDKLYEGSICGGTARKVKEIDDQYKSEFKYLHILPIREIENIIPNKILNKISSTNRTEDIDLLILTENFKIYNFKQYIDLKKSTKIIELISSRDDNYKSFWKSILTSLHENNLKKMDCYPDFQCNKTNCNCLLFQGFGENLLDNSIDFMNSISTQKIAEHSRDKCYEYWIVIGELVVSFCCGSNAIRAF